MTAKTFADTSDPANWTPNGTPAPGNTLFMDGGVTIAQPFDAKAYPYTSIVYIHESFADGTWWGGSGVLISPDEVLTADHMAWKNGMGVAMNVTCTPGLNNGTGPFGEITGKVAHYNDQIIDTPSIDYDAMQSEYAIIHLDKPVTGAGTMTVMPDFAGGTVHVTGYPGATGSMVDDVQSVTTDPNYTIYDGTTLGPGSSGSPVWINTPDQGPAVVGIVSAMNGTNGYDCKLTADKVAQINAWVKLDDAPPPPPLPPQPPQPPQAAGPVVAIYDTTTGKAVTDTLSHSYTGPVAGIQNEFIDITSDSLNVTASTPNWFIHTGSGTDAVALLSGTNVVDGSYGSNFLTSGTGADTFFVDARGAVQDTWSTITKFHSADAATLWGISPSTAALSWSDGGGAAGYTGLTLHATAAGKPTASITLSGFNTADLANGKLVVSSGHDGTSGSNYLYVHAI